MAISKIIFGDEVLLDISLDTVNANNLLSGNTAHDKTGSLVTGNCTFDADTKDGTATAPEILVNKTAYVNATKVTGTMPNNGAVTGVIDDVNDVYTIPEGYHDGTGNITIDDDEKDKIIPGNIKSGVEILGVEGTYEGEAGIGQTKTQEAYVDAQSIVTPDEGYDYLTQVTVPVIFYQEVPNASGGKTVTIGHKKPTA